VPEGDIPSISIGSARVAGRDPVRFRGLFDQSRSRGAPNGAGLLGPLHRHAHITRTRKSPVKIKSLVFMSSLGLLAAQAPLALGTGAADQSIVGTPAPGSKFAKIKPGMYSKEVMDLIGPPTDQKTYQTGKAWIPFHFGSDNYRVEYLYKGEGELTFSGGGIGNEGSLKLIKVTVNTQESGYVH
jgi:hypothetical protein